jgi:hypothetical protein
MPLPKALENGGLKKGGNLTLTNLASVRARFASFTSPSENPAGPGEHFSRLRLPGKRDKNISSKGRR